MPLPAFNSRGDLPEGVYKASRDQVVARFGHGTPQRQLVTTRLRHIYALAHATGKLQRFVIFGSYVTAKLEPYEPSRYCRSLRGGRSMLANDQELQGTQERIAYFYRLLTQMRVTATTPEEYRLFSDSYLAELERMHAEVLTCLKRHVSEPVPAEAA
jgi:hypothetical protein